MIYKAGEKIDIIAAKKCVLAGVPFKKYDRIMVELDKKWDITIDVGGGAWGCLSFSARTIKKYAKEITDLRSGKVIWRKAK